MNITTFPKLKRRHIVLWRIAVWFVLTFWAMPKRVLFYTLDFPLEVIYDFLIFIKNGLGAFCEVIYEIGITFVRYFKVCKYLIHAKEEEDSDGTH